MTAHPAADALVVGGGPAGCAAAIELARHGHRVLVVERDDGTGAGQPCGDLLVPRTLRSLDDLAVQVDLRDAHRVDRIRFTTIGRSITRRWPSHPDLPDHAMVVPRRSFDAALRDAAASMGVDFLAGHEATTPIVERGFVRGARVVAAADRTFDVRASYTVVADGANSRFGRALGTYREPTWPYALAHRAVHRAHVDDASEAELVLDLRDRAGTPITGFGWRFPRGDGTVNIGVLIMSTSPSFQVVAPARILDAVVDDHAARWQLDRDPVEPGAGGRIPLGTSVRPAAGPTYLLVGDAVGAANPLSGAGIGPAIDTGRMAGQVVAEALEGASAVALQRYPALVAERFGAYYKVGRLADRLVGHPTVSTRLGQAVSGHRIAADALNRVGGDALRSARTGPGELAYRIGRALTLIAPDA